jgi:hypothetical protein
MLGGMWYDAAAKKLYAPMHCEVNPYGIDVERQIHLASSTDKGLTWKYEGLLLSRDGNGVAQRRPPEFSGLYWDGGDGDFHLFVDERGGYIYLYTMNLLNPKAGSPVSNLIRQHVARCAIADKMAPGKWWKFYNGTWSQPGVGGKASYVNAYCVSYNSHIKKYLSVNYGSGISICDDLSKQEWSPSFHLGNYWCMSGDDPEVWATNAEKNDVFNTGESLFVYNFFMRNPGRRFRITLGEGETKPENGLTSLSIVALEGRDISLAISMDQGLQYPYTPLFESSNPTDARRTRRVGCCGAETKYVGEWFDSTNPLYYEGKAKSSAEGRASVEFTFDGTDIYWRAVKGPDVGKADVYLDGVLQATVDCWAVLPTAYQFAFIKRGLSSAHAHTIKVVVKHEKNPLSTGTVIRHMLFEYSADTYRASDNISSVQGKNQWSYLQLGGGVAKKLFFEDPVWKSADGCEIGYFHMVPCASEAVRRWQAQRSGLVRIEGTVASTGNGNEGIKASILVNGKEVWPQQMVKTGQRVAHDLKYTVRVEDQVDFVVGRGSSSGSDRAEWDPVLTYLEDGQSGPAQQ